METAVSHAPYILLSPVSAPLERNETRGAPEASTTKRNDIGTFWQICSARKVPSQPSNIYDRQTCGDAVCFATKKVLTVGSVDSCVNVVLKGDYLNESFTAVFFVVQFILLYTT